MHPASISYRCLCQNLRDLHWPESFSSKNTNSILFFFPGQKKNIEYLLDRYKLLDYFVGTVMLPGQLLLFFPLGLDSAGYFGVSMAKILQRNCLLKHDFSLQSLIGIFQWSSFLRVAPTASSYLKQKCFCISMACNCLF